MKTFTKKQAELAAKISNDISKGIDCGESKKDLRMAVDYWAQQACSESQKRAELQFKLETARIGYDLLSIPFNNDEPPAFKWKHFDANGKPITEKK